MYFPNTSVKAMQCGKYIAPFLGTTHALQFVGIDHIGVHVYYIRYLLSTTANIQVMQRGTWNLVCGVYIV